MHKIVISLILGLMLPFFTIYAGPISRQTAQDIAVAFLNSQSPLHNPISKQQVRIVPLETEYPNLFVFNVDENGFIVISNNDNTRPVLGYSRSGSLSSTDLPDALRQQLKNYDEQLRKIANEGEAVEYSPRRDTRAVEPLLTSRWKQYSLSGDSYNMLCPIDSTLFDTGFRPTVGCVALALGQVMRYWQWPVRGMDGNCYSYNDQYPCWKYDTICADFDVEYDWANMPDVLESSSSTAQRLAVARLLYQCGVAVTMMYNSDCSGSSGSNASKQYYGAVRYFGYSPQATIADRNGYPDPEWLSMLKNEIDNARPILYTGVTYSNEGTPGSGHAFVLDGYDDNDLFHVNWGWGGSADGYFAFDALTPNHYNFSHNEQAIFGFQPADIDNIPLIELLDDIALDTIQVQTGEELHGHSRMANLGNAPDDFYVAQAAYTNETFSFVQWLDTQHITLQPGDTIDYEFHPTIELPVGSYYTVMYRSSEPIDINSTHTVGAMSFPTNRMTDIDFWVTDTNHSDIYNLVIFIRFNGDEEIDLNVQALDSMFNCSDSISPSIYNYYTTLTYDQIHFHTIYANMDQNGIQTYETQHPRGYYEPYSEENPIGYEGENPFIGISMREAELLAEIINYVDEQHWVDQYQMLDGDGDGYIDNISFIAKGDVGSWASILWPHMEYFPQDSVNYPVSINGKLPHAFNLEFEAAGESLFNVNVFRHEMGHSLGLPDLYHYVYYDMVEPCSQWDMMGYPYVMNQTATILKSKYLHVGEDPICITEDGTYTLYSNATSPTQNCYYIKSRLDSTQWYTFEYRNKEDLFDEGIPETGMIIGRWCDTIPANYSGMFADPFFDFANQAHQSWIFRPNSNCDTIQGEIDRAAFSAASGRTSFGLNTNPKPYLTNGTPDPTFEIYDIQEYGDYLTFSVKFNTDNVEEPSMPQLSVFPNPTNGKFTIGSSFLDANNEVQVYDIYGKLITMQNAQNGHTEIDLTDSAPGVYIVRVISRNGTVMTTKVVKR